MSPEYSVIIPVYNAEKTLHRCVDSILAQKRDDVQIILINDGSSDTSGDICGRYAADNANVKCISKPNGGVSSARNAGIEAADGRYLSFVDSDDYVSESYFEDIDTVLSEYAYDYMLFANYFTNGVNDVLSADDEFKAQSRQQALPQLMKHMYKRAINSPWAKVYKRELIDRHGIRFPEGASIGEDRAFNITYTLYIESYRVSERPICYVNTENERSLSRKRKTDMDRQLEITHDHARRAVGAADISAEEKKQYSAAVNFEDCRVIYTKAKELHRDNVPFFKRLGAIRRLCREMNAKRYEYPKTRYCKLITLPVKLNFALVIDAMAWVLVRR